MGLANTLTGKGHDARAIAGETSQFDVIADGEVIFSKQRVGRFPEEDEITARL